MEWNPEDDELFDEQEPEPEELPDLDDPGAEFEFTDETPVELVKRIGDERVGIPTLSITDFTALIAQRAKQLAMGDPPLISPLPSTEFGAIAQAEFERGVFPLKIIRKFSDGSYEEWSVYELHRVGKVR